MSIIGNVLSGMDYLKTQSGIDSTGSAAQKPDPDETILSFNKYLNKMFKDFVFPSEEEEEDEVKSTLSSLLKSYQQSSQGSAVESASLQYSILQAQNQLGFGSPT